MPNCQVYWNGCPYHRLPRIRLPSSHTTLIAARGISRRSELKIPPNPALEQARKKYRYKLRVRRRKERSSRSWSSEARARRRGSHRARQAIEIFGWTTPEGVLASKVASETAGSASSFKPVPHKAQRELIKPQSTKSTIVHSNDGVSTNVNKISQTSLDEHKNLFSLMQVADVPIYSTSKGAAKRISSGNLGRLSIHSPRRLLSEHTHTSPLQMVSKRSTNRAPLVVDRRTYDPRTTLNNRVSKDRRTRSGFKEDIAVRPTFATSNISPKNKKNSCFGDSAYWKAVNSFALRPKISGSLSPSIRSIVESVLSEPASRTESQKKAIVRFTKELDSYLELVKSCPKQHFRSTASSSSFSIHTIDALKPYQLEFERAGLAVTAAGQKGLVKLEPPLPPPTPPKDEKWLRKSFHRSSKMAPHSERKPNKSPPKGKQPSFASGSTGTDVIGFTPPHEKSYARGAAHKGRSSSEGSVLGWTPPHERGAVLPPKATTSIPPISPPKSPTKKPLPWLRKRDSFSENSSTFKKKTGDLEFGAQSRPSDPLKGWVDSYEIKDIPSPPKFKERGESAVTPRGCDLHRSKAVNFRKQKDGIEKIKITSTPRKSIEAMVQAISPAVEVAKAPQDSNNLLDIGVRTINIIPVIPPRPPKVAWKGVEHSTQTEPCFAMETRIDSQIPRKELSFTAANKSVMDRSYTFPFTMGTGCGAGPFQPTAVLSNSNHIVDESKLRTSNMTIKPTEVQTVNFNPNVPESPIHQSPSPLSVCTQCASHLGSKVHDSNSKPSSSSHKELDVEYINSRFSTKPIVPVKDDICIEALGPKENSQQMRSVQEAIDNFGKKEPIADPMKKLSISPPMSTIPAKPPNEPIVDTGRRPPFRLPKQPIMNNTSLSVVSPSETTMGSYTLHSGQISSKKVFKGLHVVTAAACDEDIDKWIEEITGCSARKFLNDLSAFDGLGVNTLADVAKRAAKQRRERVRAWEATRERVLANFPSHTTNDVVEEKDGKLHYEASDIS